MTSLSLDEIIKERRAGAAHRIVEAIEEACSPAQARITHAKRVFDKRRRIIKSRMNNPACYAMVRKLANGLHEQVIDYKTRAFRDEMTGVLNRDGVMYAFRMLLNITRRNPNMSCAIILCDLDGLNAVNSAYLHHTGDQFIVASAKSMNWVARRSQMVVGRLGGDEFLLLIPNISADEAQILFRHVNEHVNARQYGPNGALRVSASMGMAVFRPGDTSESLMIRADQEVYKAKEERGKSATRSLKTRGGIIERRRPEPKNDTAYCECGFGI